MHNEYEENQTTWIRYDDQDYENDCSENAEMILWAWEEFINHSYNFRWRCGCGYISKVRENCLGSQIGESPICPWSRYVANKHS